MKGAINGIPDEIREDAIRVYDFLSRSGGFYSIKDIQEGTGLSYGRVKPALMALQIKGVIQSRKVSGRTVYTVG